MGVESGRFGKRRRFSYRIAGIRIAVEGERLRDLRSANPLYRRFAARVEAGDQGADISIRARSAPPPGLSAMRKVFDTRESWSLFTGAGRLWAVYQPPHQAEPFWVAGFDHRARRVDFFSPAGAGRFPPVSYPLDQLLLMHFLARRRGMLAHAAGAVVGGRAFIFPGVSGAGKSTFAGLLARDRVGRMLSDERVVVRQLQGGMTAFGTPWAGTMNIARAGQAPLAGILFLKQAKANRIEPLDPVAAADLLLPMISVPWYDPDEAAPVIAFARKVCAAVPVHEFRFTPDEAAVACFRDFVKGRRQGKRKGQRGRLKAGF